MKIEFASIGDGTNIEVLLIDEIGTRDSFYSSDRQVGFHWDKVPVHAKQLFQTLEEGLAPPVIGGRFAKFHPYWREREEKRKARHA